MDYFTETKAGLDARAALREASRCLLCLDAPCSKACPAGTSPDKFIRSLRFLNAEGAACTVRINNVLGAVCARICPTESLCQKGCLRSGIDTPIDIGALQRYLTDLEADNGWKFLSPKAENGKKVAVVGSGPAGLSASANLRLLGYSVDLYEKEGKLGGVLRYGIPEYRLPISVLDREIKRILDLGVKAHTGTAVGRDIDPAALREGYDAVLYCVGYSRGKVLDMFKGNGHVVTALGLLKEIRKDPKAFKAPDTALVIGGGDVAMDAIGSLKRLGAKKVVCVAFEELFETKASKGELEDALKIGDSFISGYMPVGASGDTVKFKHRFLDSTLRVRADLIVLAVGQAMDIEGLPLEQEGPNAKGTFHMTGDPKIYFAGDISPEKGKLAVYAVKSGKEAAHIIDKRVGGK